MGFKFKPHWFNRAWFLKQVKANTVALISLCTALSGISYNTWLDHKNEINHNMRDAAFKILTDLGELQTVVNYEHFEHNNDRGNPIEGWKYVLVIRDLSRLLKPDAAKAGEVLFVEWQNHWDALGKDSNTEMLISNKIAQTRQAVLNTIDSLD